MTDDLKLIVNNINLLLKTDYNLISFDSMTNDNLLQMLVDVLDHFNALTKFEVKFIDRDELLKNLLEALQKIQFRLQSDSIDPINFRKRLGQGDKRVIYPIFRYTFENKDRIKHLTYLAQFLLPIHLPNEALANPEIANLWEEYSTVMDQFKMAHRGHTDSSKETAHLKELRNDINAIEVEKENVNKRIERTQSRLDKVPQQELLLEAANFLRVERERQKELVSYLEEQSHQLSRFRTVQERLKKDLSNARIATQSTSPQYLMDTIEEETQVMEFLVKQKLPKEFHNLIKEISVLENIVDEPNISKEYLADLQTRVDTITQQIQKIVEHKLSERGSQNDVLIPFRQQAATVARNKDMAAEQLNETTKELRDIDAILQSKQSKLEDTIGDVILRGEELKQYVNKLRAKSSVYKQHRAELATVKAEVSDLTQTLETLKSQDPTLTAALEQMAGDSENQQETELGDSAVESRGLTELARIVDGLKRAVTGARDRVTPLSQKLRPLRERIVELKDERDSKIQNYDSVNATLKTEASVLQGEILEIEKIIRSLESNWQELKSDFERAERLLDRVKDDKQTGEDQTPLKESLQNQISEQERLLKDLQEEQQLLLSSQDYRVRQSAMWSDIKELLETKLNSLTDKRNQGIGGTMSIEKNSETFTLQ